MTRDSALKLTRSAFECAQADGWPCSDAVRDEVIAHFAESALLAYIRGAATMLVCLWLCGGRVPTTRSA